MKYILLNLVVAQRTILIKLRLRSLNMQNTPSFGSEYKLKQKIKWGNEERRMNIAEKIYDGYGIE